MANDTGKAIEIISALHDAGLLRTSRSESQPAAHLLRALSEAGLLTATGPSAAVEPRLKVGDEVGLTQIWKVEKFFTTKAGKSWVRFVEGLQETETTSYYILFPPNDEAYLEEIDKFIAAPIPKHMVPVLEITEVIHERGFHCKLLSFKTGYYMAR